MRPSTHTESLKDTADERVVVIYLRVSTDAQDIDSQRRDTYSIAAAMFPGWTTEEIADEGESAYHVPMMNRTGAKHLAALVAAGKVEAVIAQAQDRFSRQEPDEALVFMWLCAKHGTRVVTKVEGERSLDTPQDRFLSGLMTLVSGFRAFEESDNKADRSRRGRVALAQRGLWPGGPTPPGLRRLESGQLEPDELAPLIQEVFTLYARGMSVTEIARRMADLTGDATWTRPRIADCLDNIAYIGKILNSEIEYEGLHPALIDLDLWQRVRELRDEAKQSNRRQTRVQPYTSSILRCGECSGPLKSHTDAKNPSWVDYECRPCRLRYRGEFIDRAYLGALAFTHEYLSDRLADPTSGVRNDQEIDFVKAELDELRRRMKNIAPLIEDGNEDALERHRELQAQARKANKQLEQLQATTDDRRSELEALFAALEEIAADEAGPVRNRLANGWLSASIEARHRLVVAITERIEAHDRGRLEVKLRALSHSLMPRLSRESRHHADSKALRAVGFGAASPS
jgi:site-specific DNA recombinase